MNWKEFLTADERAELGKMDKRRAEAAKAFTAIRRKLQSRCESRMRRAKKTKRAS